MSWRPDCIFEIHQLWQSGFSRVYSNCCCSCSFEGEIIKIGQLSQKIYSNNIQNFEESMTILNACTTKVWKHIKGTSNWSGNDYHQTKWNLWSEFKFSTKLFAFRCPHIEKKVVGDHSRGWPEGFPFSIAYYTKVKERVLLLSLDCFTLPLIRTL